MAVKKKLDPKAHAKRAKAKQRRAIGPPEHDGSVKGCSQCAAARKKYPKLAIPPDTGPVPPSQSIARGLPKSQV